MVPTVEVGWMGQFIRSKGAFLAWVYVGGVQV